MGEQGLRDGSEHALEDSKQQIRNLGASHRRSSQNILEAKVGQVTNELATGV